MFTLKSIRSFEVSSRQQRCAVRGCVGCFMLAFVMSKLSAYQQQTQQKCHHGSEDQTGDMSFRCQSAIRPLTETSLPFFFFCTYGRTEKDVDRLSSICRSKLQSLRSRRFFPP